MAGHKHPSYFKIYILLLVLFVISVLGPELAEIIGLEDKSITRLILVLTTAFGIALVKAYYVCTYFMHLKFEKIYAPYILLSCVALLFVFFFGTATDVMKPEGHNWHKPYVAPVAATGHGHGHDDHESSENHDHDEHAHDSDDH